MVGRLIALLACLACADAFDSKYLFMPSKYRDAGAMPNTCGQWQYGTQGRAGSSVNPFCKSTDVDMGTTGTVHLARVPAQARAFDQTVTIQESDVDCSETNTCASAPASYTMETTYWNDAPCRSGEMFIRCASIDSSQFGSCGRATLNPATSKLESDSSGTFRYYTQAGANALACAQICCDGACPQLACKSDSYENCPAADQTQCPQWANCINTGNCDSKSPTCFGRPLDVTKGDNMCAEYYPGCGAVNKYPNLNYDGGAARTVMKIVASGTIVDMTETTYDGTTLTNEEVMNKMCGADNNIFSYKPAASAADLATAPTYPTPLTSWPKECSDGPPNYCACSRMAAIHLSSILVTINDADVLNDFNSNCQTSCRGSSPLGLGSTIQLASSSCTASTCQFLSEIGYDFPNHKYYLQYYRPKEDENMLYFGHQSTSVAAALETKIHGDGVYQLKAVCGACSIGAHSLLVSILASVLGMYYVRNH